MEDFHLRNALRQTSMPSDANARTSMLWQRTRWGRGSTASLTKINKLKKLSVEKMSRGRALHQMDEEHIVFP